MQEDLTISLDQSVNILRAAGEQTRLRMLALLAENDLTVSELIEILGQSQPRVSRHLKLLAEAGLLERYQEGAWAYFRIGEYGRDAGVIDAIIQTLDKSDPNIARDNGRLEMVRKKRATKAAEYFSNSADDWDKIRSLHIDEAKVEAAMLEMVGPKDIDSMLDLGTGTGRILELFSGQYKRATGIDASREMLSVARARIDDAKLSRVQIRQGDLYILPTQSNSYDLVTIHQVLHFLDDPAGAIYEAASALVDGGRLLIVDFAPHNHDFLREKHAHIRFGFSTEQMIEWLDEAGVRLVETRNLDTNEKTTDALTVSLWLAEK